MLGVCDGSIGVDESWVSLGCDVSCYVLLCTWVKV